MASGEQAPNAWKVLFLLFLANLLNFFDRAVPAIVIEPVRREWGLSDFQIGLAAAAFTITYALAGLPLGRIADTGSRKKVMAWGLIAWSGFTALCGATWSFGSFIAMRIGVGIGEASYAPAASSLIGDLFPAHKRARAAGIFMLGLPLGLILAFFSVGAMAKAFDSWRAPFVIAMFPGLIVAALMFTIREPARGSAEAFRMTGAPVDRPIRALMRIPTLWWMVAAGVAANFAAYSASAFLVPLLQRYFGLPLESAAVSTGIIVGLTGLVGLIAGGWITDFLHQRFERGRLVFAAVCLAGGAVLTWFALSAERSAPTAFVTLFALGWLLQYSYYTSLYPAMQDIVDPRLRATATAVFFAALYLLGGAFGPLVVGFLSDHYAQAAMQAAGASEMTEEFKALGLHGAMILVPISLAATSVALWFASRSFPADARAMQRGVVAAGAGA